jgi:hypothetical protein
MLNSLINIQAEVAELADALDSKSSELNTRAGSTPAFCTLFVIFLNFDLRRFFFIVLTYFIKRYIGL